MSHTLLKSILFYYRTTILLEKKNGMISIGMDNFIELVMIYSN